MAHGVEVVVCHHLRFAARAAGKVHQHRVVILVDEGRTLEFRRLPPFLPPVAESFFVAQCDILFHRRALWHGQLDLTDNIIVVGADDGLHRCTRVSIDVVVLGQHVCCGDDDGANLTQREHDDPPLIVTLQNEHYGVVLADAQCL